MTEQCMHDGRSGPCERPAVAAEHFCRRHLPKKPGPAKRGPVTVEVAAPIAARFESDSILAACYLNDAATDRAVRHAVATTDTVVGFSKRWTVPKGESLCRPLSDKLAGDVRTGDEVTCPTCLRLMASSGWPSKTVASPP